jgi:hypothetical protein
LFHPFDHFFRLGLVVEVTSILAEIKKLLIYTKVTIDAMLVQG